jgi:hypothetical protein
MWRDVEQNNTSNLSHGSPPFLNPLGRGEARVFARLASLASLAPTRASPRATLGFEMVFRPGETQDLKGEPIHRLNQTKIDLIDREIFKRGI